MMKRHARPLTDPARLLWVGDERDWQFMRSRPSVALRCPAAGCASPLHAVSNARGTRFLRHTAATGARQRDGCDHWWVTGSPGGPESNRHLWLKARLAAICLHLGWQAVPEDPGTFADVWIPDARLALEVQLRRTDMRKRTRARFSAGAAAVVWFIAADVPAAKTLFAAPAVRFEVVSPVDATRRVAPWEVLEPARIVLWATVWRWDHWRLVTGRLSAYRFLAEVLADRMGWCPPGTPGLPPGRGGWVRWSDLALAAGVPDAESEQIRPDVAAWLEGQWQRTGREAG